MSEAAAANTLKKRDGSRMKVPAVSPKAPARELRETMREAARERRKHATAMSEGIGRSAANIPMEAATPFPPRQFRKGDQLWPQTAANPAKEAKAGLKG